MPKDDLVYIGHMLDMSREALELVRGKSRNDFDNDRVLSLALTHLLQTIGEAARCVSPECRARNPEIPWAAIIGLRHRIVHDYMDIDLDMVWDIATGDLAPLAVQLARLAPEQ